MVIPSIEVISYMIVAFFVGLGSLYLFFKLRVITNTQSSIHVAKLEYYEKLLIDMKIRLDALEMQNVEQKPTDSTDLKQSLEVLIKNIVKEQDVPKKQPKEEKTTYGLEYGSAVDHVLHLITNKAMTSRDIQITLKRSREHTSRLLKKLFEDGFVERTQTKPYAYTITQKGKERVSRELENITV